MMSFDQLCWLTQIASTWYMTGLIWFVQVVHYPLMAAVALPSGMRPAARIV